MRVVFLPTGGFGEAGGFVELDEGEEPSQNTRVFQRQEFITPEIECINVKIVSQYDVHKRIIGKRVDENEVEKTNDVGEGRAIISKGSFLGARWGKYSLSFLGSNKKHESIDVIIRDASDIQNVVVAGHPEIDDIDLKSEESFFLQFDLPTKTYEKVESEVASGGRIKASVRLSHFKGFISTWSPALDEGRLIKYYDYSTKLENSDQLSDTFWKESRDDDDFWLSEPSASFWIERPVGDVSGAEGKNDLAELGEDAELVDFDEVGDLSDQAAVAPHRDHHESLHQNAISKSVWFSGLVIAGAILVSGLFG